MRVRLKGLNSKRKRLADGGESPIITHGRVARACPAIPAIRSSSPPTMRPCSRKREAPA